ncbi:hypothetical protein EBR66_02220 [bacterium]|nr:hypothetical protein [bacterium]
MATFKTTEPGRIHADIMLHCMGDVILIERETGHSVTIPGHLMDDEVRKTIVSFCSGCEPGAEITVVSSDGPSRMQWPPIRR